MAERRPDYFYGPNAQLGRSTPNVAQNLSSGISAGEFLQKVQQDASITSVGHQNRLQRTVITRGIQEDLGYEEEQNHGTLGEESPLGLSTPVPFDTAMAKAYETYANTIVTTTESPTVALEQNETQETSAWQKAGLAE